MKIKSIIWPCLFFFSWQILAAEDYFRVAPYLLKHTDGNLILNFQTAQDADLIVEDNGIDKNSFAYKKNEHYKIELSTANCGSIKEVKILDAGTKDVLYKNTQPPAPCQSSLKNNEAFVFGFISDTQQYIDRHADIAGIIAQHHAIEPMQFLINGGDVVQEGGTEQEWINYFIGGKLYLMDIPQIAAIGNHDYRGSKGELVPKYFQQFMRWNGSDINGNLFFEFPEMQLLILNSNFGKLGIERDTWKWVEEKLQAAQKSHKPIIIATHFPVFSSSLNRFTSFNVMKMNGYLVPLVEKYKVKLVLSGHTHMYERSLKNGINYLVAGPAGGRANSPTAKNEYMQVFDKDSLTFTKLSLLNKKLNVETYNQDNKLIDSLDIDLNSI